jgi:hypothetical protein
MEVSGQPHAPAALPPTGWEAGWAPEPVLNPRRRKNSCTTGNIYFNCIWSLSLETDEGKKERKRGDCECVVRNVELWSK